MGDGASILVSKSIKHKLAAKTKSTREINESLFYTYYKKR